MRLTAQGFKGVQTGLFCNTYKESRKRQFLPSKLEFPNWLGKHNESNLEFVFDEKFGGHRIAFLNLEDPTQYKSDQFATIGIEELTLCPNPAEVIDILSGSLRWPGVDWTPMGFTTNPDGPGHSQVKGMFVTKTVFDHPDFKNKRPDDYRFVRALPTDNPHLPEHYITEILGGLPDSLRAPWLEGSWDLFEGQRFKLIPRIHVCRPFPLPAEARLYRAIDYGFDNPAACTWYAVMPKGSERPDVMLYREWAQSGLDARQQARKILELTPEEEEIRIERPAYLDTACWKHEDDGLTIARKFEQEGVRVQQSLKDRATGWTYVEDLLHHRWSSADRTELETRPRLVIFETCPLAIQQLTDALWDPKKPGDILHPEGFRDDVLDTIRYFALTHFKQPEPEPEKFPLFDHAREVARLIERG